MPEIENDPFDSIESAIKQNQLELAKINLGKMLYEYNSFSNRFTNLCLLK